jgi:glutathione S-transferase
MVWLYCIEHGVPVELQFLEDKRGLTTTAEFHSMNPFHTVPVLKDGDVVLFESVAILHYLAQEYSHFAGFGPDVATRARAGSLVCWASKNLLK